MTDDILPGELEVKLEEGQEAWLLSHSLGAKNDSLNPEALHHP